MKRRLFAGRHSPGRSWPGRLLFSGLAVALALAVLAFVVDSSRPGEGLQQLTSVQRLEPDGSTRPVGLPDEHHVPSGTQGSALASYTWQADLGPAPSGQALYFPGLLGSARLVLNGQPVVDEIGTGPTPLPPRPRGRAALRVIDLPAYAVRPGVNEFQLDVAGRQWLSLSPIWLGARHAAHAMQERKAMAMVTGPVVVATAIGGLGLAMLLLWARRPSEHQYGYFGGAGVLWSLHTLWTNAPSMGLQGIHLVVWWNTLYAAVVTLLVLFAQRFVQWQHPALERGLRWALVAVAPGLYLAAGLGLLNGTAAALRLGLIVMALTGLGLVARHAWHRRSASSAMFVLAGAASAGLGLRDWWVFEFGNDNNPVQLTPYAGAPFIVLVGWVLIERFVRTADSLEAINLQLEQRVAQREVELAESFGRMAQLERQQVAGDERQRLLRELHDGLGAKLLTSLGRLEHEALDRDHVSRELRECLADMRLASEALKPGQADVADVVGNLLFRWEGLLREAGLRPVWQLDLPVVGVGIEPYKALQLLRIMQEALTNALRHAQARQVVLTLRLHQHQLALTIEDDGRGLPVPLPSQGRGLAAMRSRAEAIGSTLALGARAGGGTRLELHLPLETG